MTDLSDLPELYLNEICDDFEAMFATAGSAGDNYEADVDVSVFLDDLSGSPTSPLSNAKFLKELTTELLAIELQKAPFPSADELRQKYPRFVDEIFAAAQLTQNRNGTNEVNISNFVGSPPDVLQLPVEEALHRNLNAGAGSPTSKIGELPRRTFGRYQLTGRLGAGGYGLVFRAHDPVMQRDVAIKLPRLSLLNEPSDARRLELEIATLAQLSHPHIVTAFHAEEIEGYFCLISEFVKEGNLEQWLARRSVPVTPKTAAAIAAQLCEALKHAHGMGVIHCDIKPSNILISSTTDGVPNIKLADFGLAKLLKDSAAVTSTGMAVGTLQFMSPEQLTRREKFGFTSDIYSVGIVLYRLLAGQCPFDSENEIELISQIVERQPTGLHSSSHRVPAGLAAIVSRCLMKRPCDRYSSATALEEDLQRFMTGQPVDAKPLGIAGKLSHWSRNKNRIRDAGLYSLWLALVLTVWSVLAMPIYHASGLLDQLGIERAFESIATAILLLAVLVAPICWAAFYAVRYDPRGIVVALAASLLLTAVMLLFLVDVISLDFGGMYRDRSVRVVSFTLLSFLTGFQIILFGIAWYAAKNHRYKI